MHIKLNVTDHSFIIKFLGLAGKGENKIHCPIIVFGIMIHDALSCAFTTLIVTFRVLLIQVLDL